MKDVSGSVGGQKEMILIELFENQEIRYLFHDIHKIMNGGIVSKFNMIMIYTGLIRNNGRD